MARNDYGCLIIFVRVGGEEEVRFWFVELAGLNGLRHVERRVRKGGYKEKKKKCVVDVVVVVCCCFVVVKSKRPKGRREVRGGKTKCNVVTTRRVLQCNSESGSKVQSTKRPTSTRLPRKRRLNSSPENEQAFGLDVFHRSIDHHVFMTRVGPLIVLNRRLLRSETGAVELRSYVVDCGGDLNRLVACLV